MSEPGVLLSCGSGGLDGREGAKAPGWACKDAGSPWSGCESVEGSWGIRGSACGPGRRGAWRPCGRRDLPSSSPGLARSFRRRGCEVSGCRRDLPGAGRDGCGFCAQCTSGRGILRAAPPGRQGGDPVWAFSCGRDGDRLLVGRGAVEVVCGVGRLAQAKVPPAPANVPPAPAGHSPVPANVPPAPAGHSQNPPLTGLICCLRSRFCSLSGAPSKRQAGQKFMQA